MVRTVLFVCVENACRSLMAEAMFNARAPQGWSAVSAGTEPGADANPRTGPMLKEVGLELPPHPPQRLTDEMLRRSDVRITMGCLDRASCPANLKHLDPTDWAMPDPARLDDEGFRRVRDDLAERVRRLLLELSSGDRAPGRAPRKPAPPIDS